ncbi:valyl-tRNA synthetase [Candidatus Hakubella thermalkaliphila]|uniref:Valine--tRNA ligase n=4 Tax=Candidatus Hakubella thermalkaliphila TaxID=2754717 RepID=A0A6V8PWW4_9ACTN|nr:valine--tRNA ligase [Candidatus Hakubella thermalkaliphila]GFP18673.1 valyl-tRNA synthetase [Candidatus Hakubella thermalkaliphila]GFP29325.1 valyl-tRNA synthetase [Candidatus Hakubella thermalkaliphila]GFP36797.1 valyl-tRNA synthetase [Candidatus Hakubella thermalkaliphila]GFP41728.1 valyl-tRNA synthetase [Candidatus Hakubella thermalkaliphila]
MPELPDQYKPAEVEKKIYSFWEEKRLFHAEVDSSREPFVIVIPPPNVTGSLHMGHALNNVLQDIIIRYKRMKGLNACWIPGTDHAGIATQNVVEKELMAEGLTRQQLGREKFLERVWAWKEKYGNRIIDQLKALGASADWERQRFTMDEGCSRAVRTFFVKLYQDGLIYRGDYMINWCPRCHTALSDIEVEHHPRPEAALWRVRYPLKDQEGYIVVATTRPETMLGDTAVAVNPKDPRYRQLVGRMAILPLLNRELPIIEDEYVDPQFGTGALKITPAHDPHDFEVAVRHGLPLVNIFTESAVTNENAGPYQGLERSEARRRVVADLERLGLVEGQEKYSHSVGQCYRCDTMVEPRISRQWFLRMKPLAGPAVEAVREGRIEFIPSPWAKVYFDWMQNIRDWCISRQIWWGHRIPAWYCRRCGQEIVTVDDPQVCPGCSSEELHQEDDVLDTWFSSALWPFSTLGWPDDTEDLRYFYPTDVLVTGHDIIFFWVARMIMAGLYGVGDVPFHQVFINPLVSDIQGQKMSKSRGNVIDPLDVIGKCGTDALRFTISFLTTPGRDVLLGEERIEGMRNFANKIWNASRFILMNVGDGKDLTFSVRDFDLALHDRWILSQLSQTARKVEEELARYNFSQASKALYDFFWGRFCDWYIEMSKRDLYRGEKKDSDKARSILLYVQDRFLRLLHPFMPFITEEIWQLLPHDGESIMVASYPSYEESLIDEEADRQMEALMEVVTEVRRLRSEHNINPAQKLRIVLVPANGELKEIWAQSSGYIMDLARVEEMRLEESVEHPGQYLKGVAAGAELYVEASGLIDLSSEKERLRRQMGRLDQEIKRSQEKLANQNYLSRAPEGVVARERTKLQEFQEVRDRLQRQIENRESLEEL